MILILLKSIFNMSKNNIGVNQKKPRLENKHPKGNKHQQNKHTHFTSNKWKQNKPRHDVGNPDLGLGHEQKSGGAKPENDIPTLCLNFTSDCVRHVDV